jgi:hypothetical protein
VLSLAQAVPILLVLVRIRSNPAGKSRALGGADDAITLCEDRHRILRTFDKDLGEFIGQAYAGMPEISATPARFAR